MNRKGEEGASVGSTIIVAIIVLALIAIFAIIAFKLGKGGPDIIDGPLNMLNKS